MRRPDPLDYRFYILLDPPTTCFFNFIHYKYYKEISWHDRKTCHIKLVERLNSEL